MSEFGSFNSVFDDSAPDPLRNDEPEASGDTSENRPSPEYEERTLYVSEEEGPPQELEELNDALRNQWTIQDIDLGYRENEDCYCFIISLARTQEPSLFDFAE
jgi:hypothetical protein